MKNLKIPIPKGFQFKSYDRTTNEVEVEEVQIDIKEKLNNFSDVLEYHGINPETFQNSCFGLSEDEVGYRKVKLIVEAYNEGQKPDFSDDDQTKYVPWFRMGSPSGVGFSYDDYGYWGTDSGVGSRLVYLSLDNLRDAVEKFLPEYQQFFTK